MSELDDLRKACGKWCFPGGRRCLRSDRIKELEASEAVKPKAKAKAKKKGKTDAKSEARATDEA